MATEVIGRFGQTLIVITRVALLVGPLAFAVLTLHVATLYRSPAHADYRTGSDAGRLSGE